MCLNQFYGIKGKKQYLSCDGGSFKMLKYFGANAKTRPHQLIVRNNKTRYFINDEERRIGNAYCGPSDVLEKQDDCSQMIDKVKINETFIKSCVNKTNCEIDLTDPNFISLDYI